ncbi:MAG TPA: hypothetical protein VNJ04_11435 [Gemmatimonadaceae bacterium]|nr:hypothetical protein [Gemmatimonadaceae bacterium]
MRLIGVVQRTGRDKNGIPIAAVLPLLEIKGSEWRTIDADEEFPTRGQVFWFAANQAVEDGLVQFRADPNPGQKDEYRLLAPESVWEVLDLRRFGDPTEIRAALINGLKVPGPTATVRGLLLCKPEALVGPVDLTRAPDSTVRLSGAALHRVPLYQGAVLRSIAVNGRERLIRIDETAPSGFVDWDDDAIVLKRAIEVSVRIAKQEGRDTGQTKKQIEEAARTLASSGVGPDTQLDRYRLERALALLKDTNIVAGIAAEIAEKLRGHPAIEISLEEIGAKVRSDVEKVARDEIEQQLTRERAALKETTDALARAKAQLETSSQALRDADKRVRQVQDQLDSVAREAEAAVDERVRAAIDRPLDLLAQVSVLRPLLGGGRSHPATPSSGGTPLRIDWSRARGEDIKDKASLRRILTSAARARGVDPSLMLQIHAAVAARLMPVTLGPGALLAVTAYAQGACGGRLLIVHVSPSAIQPHDFDEVSGGGILAAAAAAKDIEGISLVILEGANRSPLEASVVPLLQLAEVGLSPLSSAPGLRLAATLVAGATTVPVTPQFWSHAAAIYPEPVSPSTQTGARGDAALPSELFDSGDEPTGVIDALLDTWPDCRELRPSMSRFGSVLTRLYDEESRITDALRTGLVLPYVATALTVEEQAEALSEARDADGSIALALRRLRRTIA